MNDVINDLLCDDGEICGLDLKDENTPNPLKSVLVIDVPPSPPSPPSPPAPSTEVSLVTIVYMRRRQISAADQLVPHCEVTSPLSVPPTLAVPSRPT